MCSPQWNPAGGMAGDLRDSSYEARGLDAEGRAPAPEAPANTQAKAKAKTQSPAATSADSGPKRRSSGGRRGRETGPRGLMAPLKTGATTLMGG